MLSKAGTATSPIIIRAKDPKNRPVWDLAGKDVGSWPGSYSAPDKNRGAWQVASSGAYYQISGIVFRNCQSDSSAGFRTINSGPVTVRDCVFENSTNGITGSSSDYVVEFCEFNKNGKLTSTGSPTHNIYIYGGKFTLRYSYLHDPVEGQNFHVRAADTVIEYNWITRPASYPGDLMTCENQCGASPVTQKMLLRGNVIIQASPSNMSQIVSLYNDSGSSSIANMELTMINNTVIGTQVAAGKTQVLVNMRNDGVGTKVTLHNNILYQLAELAAPYDATKTNWSITGQSNWVTTGTKINGTLSGTVMGTSPGFVNAAGKDYHLTSGSPCRNKAAAVSGLPVKEYYLNEVTKLQYRPRATAKDLGAFEYGNTAAPVGPYGSVTPTPDAGVPDASPPDAGPPPPDKSVLPPDKSVPPPDKGVVKQDKGVVKQDKGVVKQDTGTTKQDTGGAGDGPAGGDGPAAGDGPASTQDGTAGDAAQVQSDGGLQADALEGGCGCRLDASPATGAGASALLLLIALLLIARRRRLP